MALSHPRRAPRHLAFTRTLIAVAVSGSLLTTLTPAVAQPVNPEDSAIADATATADSNAGDVSRLAGELSSTELEINRLEMRMGGLRELVNKALVDLHDAQASAEQARQTARAAREDLDATQAEIEAAQERLDEISRTAYRQGATSPGMSGLSGNGTSEDSLDRQTYLRTQTEKQRDAIEQLDRLRTENANKESRLRRARILAEEREAAAVAQEQTTRAAIEDNSRQIADYSSQRDRLVGERDSAQERLNSARADVDTLHSQRREYEEYQAAEEERIRAEAEAAAAAEERRQAEQEAAERARVAAEQAEQQRQAQDRAAAQAAAQQAAREAEQARIEAEARAADEAAAEQLLQTAAEAAAIAAAALVAANQPDHGSLDNPYPDSEDADVTPIAPIQNPELDPGASVDPDLDLVDVDSLETVTDAATEIVAGSREERIETVINRAMGQIGVPYAWGGGDASGPTLGIRDGGVADSFGDYNKIGFDCSGLVLYAFAGIGIALPHYTGYQYQHGTKVSPNEMQRGDLIFWGPGASQHVAIYLGDGQMIEAPQSGSTVQISPVRWSGMTEYAVRLI